MDIKKLLDEQKHLCQTEFDKRSVLIDGVWFVACEDVLKAPYPKQLNLCEVSKPLNALFQIGDKVKFKNVINGQVTFVNENTGLVDVDVENQTTFINCKPEWLEKGSI